MINGLAGVIVWTENFDGMVEFYCKNLGFTPHSIRSNFVSFKWDGVRLGIGKHSEVRGSTIEPNRIMINFGVSDIRKECGILRDAGVIIIREPEKEHWGGWVATLLDPDGNTIQLLQHP